MERSVRQLVKDWAGRVVALQNEDGALASGIAWRKGYVVSAEEAVGDQVKVFDGSGREIAADFVGRDPSTDIALFKADIDPAPFEVAAQVEPGDFALAVGRGATSELVAAGIVAETGGEWRSSFGGTIDRKIGLGLTPPMVARSSMRADDSSDLPRLVRGGQRLPFPPRPSRGSLSGWHSRARSDAAILALSRIRCVTKMALPEPLTSPH
jgi:hypothetical protein